MEKLQQAHKSLCIIVLMNRQELGELFYNFQFTAQYTSLLGDMMLMIVMMIV